MILNCYNISKSFGANDILKNASFHIEEREKAIQNGVHYSEMLPEEKELIQDIVNDSYNQFLEAITKGRIQREDKDYSVAKTNLTEENLKTYADGRVFTGKKAKTLGFVDENGDMNTAETIMTTMTQEKFNNKLPVKLVNYNKKSSINEYFSSLAEYSSQGSIKITEIIPTSMLLNRKPLYLWE